MAWARFVRHTAVASVDLLSKSETQSMETWRAEAHEQNQSGGSNDQAVDQSPVRTGYNDEERKGN